MTRAYPVQAEVSSPPRFERTQLVIRLLFAIVLGWIGITAGWLMWVLYGALPLVAAITISARGADHYVLSTGPQLMRVLTWLLQLSAYMALLVDRFPLGGEHPVRIQAVVTARPTIGSALLRLVTSIPSGLVLVLLSLVGSVLWLIAALYVLVAERVPESILAFLRGLLRWQARLVAYHASIVDEYPPFAFDTEEGHEAPLATSGTP
jgi:hypothetical protein